MCKCHKLIKAIDNYIAKADNDLKDELEKMGYVEPDLTIDKITSLEDSITEALQNENDYIIKHTQDTVDIKEFAKYIWGDIKLNDETNEKLYEIFKEQLQSFLPELIEPYIQTYDSSLKFVSVSKKTLSFIDGWSSQLGQMMRLTTHTTIDNILKSNLEKGNGIQSFVLDIQNSGIRNERYRARSTAVTEVLRVHSMAHEEAIQQSPVVDRKEWRHTGSYKNNPRENHEAMDGQIVGKDEPFTLYGVDGSTYYPLYPRDPSLPASESINCHCIHRGIVNDDIFGLTLEERRQMQAEAIAEMDENLEDE